MSDDPNPAIPPDPAVLRKTMRWLWLRKQAYQFMHRALRRKRIALEHEEAVALKQANVYKARIQREYARNPSLRSATPDVEGDEWKE